MAINDENPPESAPAQIEPGSYVFYDKAEPDEIFEVESITQGKAGIRRAFSNKETHHKDIPVSELKLASDQDLEPVKMQEGSFVVRLQSSVRSFLGQMNPWKNPANVYSVTRFLNGSFTVVPTFAKKSAGQLHTTGNPYSMFRRASDEEISAAKAVFGKDNAQADSATETSKSNTVENTDTSPVEADDPETPVEASPEQKAPKSSPQALDNLFNAHSTLQDDLKAAEQSFRYLKQTKTIKGLPPLTPDHFGNIEEKVESVREYLQTALDAADGVKAGTTGAFNTLNDAHYKIYLDITDIVKALVAFKNKDPINELLKRQKGISPDTTPFTKSEQSTYKHLSDFEQHIHAARWHIGHAREASAAANTTPSLNRD